VATSQKGEVSIWKKEQPYSKEVWPIQYH